MNIAEIKLDLLRRIDKLSDSELEDFYNKFLILINKPSKYLLNDNEKLAINDALQDQTKKYSHDEVIKEASKKFPNLKFK